MEMQNALNFLEAYPPRSTLCRKQRIHLTALLVRVTLCRRYSAHHVAYAAA